MIEKLMKNEETVEHDKENGFCDPVWTLTVNYITTSKGSLDNTV